MARPPRPTVCLEVPIRMDLKEPKTATFTTVILYLNLSDHDFLWQPASQLQCGAGGTLGDAREDLMARRKHRSVPFWARLSYPAPWVPPRNFQLPALGGGSSYATAIH